jgi:hypothetical protein
MIGEFLSGILWLSVVPGSIWIFLAVHEEREIVSCAFPAANGGGTALFEELRFD